MSIACKESMLIISDVVSVENEYTNLRAAQYDRYGRHLHNKQQVAQMPCPLGDRHIALKIETYTDNPCVLKCNKDIVNNVTLYPGSSCVNCDCPCICCVKVPTKIDVQRLQVYAEIYQSNYLSTLLTTRTEKAECESYFTTDRDTYHREEGLCWELLHSRPCRNMYCVCICRCCLQEPFKMTLPERIAFEHWLDLAHDVYAHDESDYDDAVGCVNPLRFVAGNTYEETNLDRDNDADDDLADMMECL